MNASGYALKLRNKVGVVFSWNEKKFNGSSIVRILNGVDHGAKDGEVVGCNHAQMSHRVNGVGPFARIRAAVFDLFAHLAQAVATAVQVVDALSYEGGITIAEMTSVGLGSNVNLVEGVAASATDNGAGSLCRIPSSKDTDNAAADWALSMTPTPGEANVP